MTTNLWYEDTILIASKTEQNMVHLWTIYCQRLILLLRLSPSIQIWQFGEHGCNNARLNTFFCYFTQSPHHDGPPLGYFLALVGLGFCGLESVERCQRSCACLSAKQTHNSARPRTFLLRPRFYKRPQNSKQITVYFSSSVLPFFFAFRIPNSDRPLGSFVREKSICLVYSRKF